MTTKIIQSANVYSPASVELTGWPESATRTTGTIKTFDLRSDELPHTGADEEFAIEDYLDDQESEVRAAVDAQGHWVAETLYPGENTLATMRLRAGLSQKELAARCNFEQPHVSRYESGRTEPGVFAAKRIAIALGVSLDQLVDALENTLKRSPR